MAGAGMIGVTVGDHHALARPQGINMKPRPGIDLKPVWAWSDPLINAVR